MTIKEQINIDFMEAYKAKNMDKKNFLGVLKGALQTQEGKGVESTNENVLKLIKSFEKGINETIVELVTNNLPTDIQTLELSYIKPYQPELMSEEAIREAIHQIIIDSGESNMGKLMGLFNSKFTGKADNKIVSKLLKEELA